MYRLFKVHLVKYSSNTQIGVRAQNKMQAFKKKINLMQISEFRPFTEETKNMARLHLESVSDESLIFAVNKPKKENEKRRPSFAAKEL